MKYNLREDYKEMVVQLKLPHLVLSWGLCIHENTIKIYEKK